MLSRSEVMDRVDEVVEEYEEMDGRKKRDLKYLERIVKELADVIELNVRPGNLVATGTPIREKELLANKMDEYRDDYDVHCYIEWVEPGVAEITISRPDDEIGNIYLKATPFLNKWDNLQFELTFDDDTELPRQLGWVIRDHFGLDLENDEE